MGPDATSVKSSEYVIISMPFGGVVCQKVRGQTTPEISHHLGEPPV